MSLLRHNSRSSRVQERKQIIQGYFKPRNKLQNNDVLGIMYHKGKLKWLNSNTILFYHLLC